MKSPEPTTNYDDYRQAILVDLEKPAAEWTFRATPGYRHILEHVTYAEAEAFLVAMKEMWPTYWNVLQSILIETALLNDSLGTPIKMFFPSLGITCAPSNMRYMCHALLAWECIERNMHPVHIIELGAGYGGLALYMHELAIGMTQPMLSYTTVDLPEAAILQQRFLDEIHVPVSVVNGLDIDGLKAALRPNDGVSRFFISAYAFSEFDEVAQDWYAEHLIKHCEHGFVVWNYADNWPHRPPNSIYLFVPAEMNIRLELPAIFDGKNTWVTF